MSEIDDYFSGAPVVAHRHTMLDLIQREHAQQTRNGGRVPYWMHCQSVAEILDYAVTQTQELALDPALGADLYLAAQGHDLYEDTKVSQESIRAIFGARVHDLIIAMTNAAGDDDRTAYVQCMATATEEVLLIKLADLADNLASSAYGVHDLGAQWVGEFLMPIVDEMRATLHAASFQRYPRTAALLLELVDFHWVRLGQNRRKFQYSMQPETG